MNKKQSGRKLANRYIFISCLLANNFIINYLIANRIIKVLLR